MSADDLRNDYEPFQQDGKWWYWQCDDSKAGPFKTERAASLSAQREFCKMFPVIDEAT